MLRRWKTAGSQRAQERPKSIHDILPVELIARVLLLVPRPDCYYLDTICLSRADSRIREIMVSTPQFWTTIMVSSERHLKFARICLERSKDCGVDCYVLMTSLEEHAMVEIRSFLHECQPKMRSFELTAADIQNPILASAIAGLDLPVLHQASYEIGSSNYHTTTFQIPRMPQLRSISITGRVFPQVHSGSSMEEDSPFRYNELTRLTLHRCTLHELHFKQLMDFISYAPSLSHLSFIVVGVDGHAHEVNVQAQPTRERRTFASIRHLTFRQVSITHLDRIFEIIDSFQLETIELGDLNEPVYAWLKDKGTVFPSVRRFTISPENTSPTHVVDVHGLALLLMEVFPHLTDVEIPYWRAKLLTDWMVHFPPPETDPVKARGLPVSQDSSAMELPWVGIRSIRVTKEPTDDLGMEIALGHLVPFARRSKPFLKTPLRVIIEWRRSSATPCSRIMMKALESVIGRTRW